MRAHNDGVRTMRPVGLGLSRQKVGDCIGQETVPNGY